jgi:hypothetical protein
MVQHFKYLNYFALEDGTVFNNKSGKLIIGSEHHTGYKVFTITDIDGNRFTYRLHRFILESYLGRPLKQGYVVNHKDGIKGNNKIDNLEEVTPSENTKHAFAMSLCTPQKGEDNAMSILKECEVKCMIRDVIDGYDNDALANKYGVHSRYVSLIRHKKRWKHIFELDEFIDYTPIKSNKETSISHQVKYSILSDLYYTKLTFAEIGKKYKVDPSMICRAYYGKVWKELIAKFNQETSTTIPQGSRVKLPEMESTVMCKTTVKI